MILGSIILLAVAFFSRSFPREHYSDNLVTAVFLWMVLVLASNLDHLVWILIK